MDPAHLNKLFSICNWLFLIPCYCQNSIGDLWNTLVPTKATMYVWVLTIGEASFDELSLRLDVFPKLMLYFLTTSCWSVWASRLESPASIGSSFPFDWSFSEPSACDFGCWLGEVTSRFSGQVLLSTPASSSAIGNAAKRSVVGSCACWDVSALLCSIPWWGNCLGIKRYSWNENK